MGQTLPPMSQKITHWLILSLILSLGFGQLLRFEAFGLPLYLHDALVLMILCILTVRTLLNSSSWQQAKKGSSADDRRVLTRVYGLKLFLAGLVLGWIFALTQYSISHLLIPSLYTLRLLAYLSLYLLIKANQFRIQYSIFLISGLTTLLIGLSQYLILPDMRWAQYLGWDDHLSRLTLPHFDPTFTGVLLALALLSRPNPLISPLPSLLYLLPILLTYSRSVWLSLVLTSFVYIKNKKIILASSILLLVAILFLPQKFGEGTNLLRTYSITSRLTSDWEYIKKYNFSLIVGRGFNTLPLDTPVTSLPNHATGPNNSYLYILASTGALGLIGWGSFMLSLYRKSSHKPMLAFFFIASLFNNVMFYPFALLWVLLVESLSVKNKYAKV